MVDKAHAPYPYLGVNGAFFDKAFLESVETQLLQKAPLWAAGIDKPTPCERFAYHVLTHIKMNGWK